MNDKRFLIYLILLHLVFFITKVLIGGFFLEDSHEYYRLANNILSDFEFYCQDLNAPIANEYYTKRPPFYAIFLIFSSLFLQSKISVLLFQNILSIGSIFLVKRIFEDTFRSPNYVLLLAFLATSISQFIYSNLLMSEILLQFLVVLLVFQVTIFTKNPSWKNIMYYQIIIVLLFLTKPVFYLFVVPNLFISFLLIKRSRVKFGFLSSGLPILALILYCYWNYQRTGSSDFSSIQNINLLEWNLRFYEDSKTRGGGKLFSTKILKEAEKIENYGARQNFIKKEAFSYLKKNLFSYLIFHAKGSARMLLDPGRFDVVNFFNYQKGNPNKGILYHLNTKGVKGVYEFLKTNPLSLIITIVALLIFNTIKVFGFVYFWVKNHRDVPFPLWIAVFIILYIVGLTGPLGASRFVVPVLLFFLSFSVLGIEDFLRNTFKKLPAMFTD